MERDKVLMSLGVHSKCRVQPQRNARLPRFSLVLGIESCCEVDDLRYLGMLEKCIETSQIRWF